MKVKMIAVIVIVFSVAVFGALALAQSENTTYYACVNKSSGRIHMVGPDDDCSNNEQLVEWNQAGPQGLPGAPGATGLHCWDLNGNGAADPLDEDLNHDGDVNVADCRAEQPAANYASGLVGAEDVEHCVAGERGFKCEEGYLKVMTFEVWEGDELEIELAIIDMSEKLEMTLSKIVNAAGDYEIKVVLSQGDALAYIYLSPDSPVKSTIYRDEDVDVESFPIDIDFRLLGDSLLQVIVMDPVILVRTVNSESAGIILQAEATTTPGGSAQLRVLIVNAAGRDAGYVVTVSDCVPEIEVEESAQFVNLEKNEEEEFLFHLHTTGTFPTESGCKVSLMSSRSTVYDSMDVVFVEGDGS